MSEETIEFSRAVERAAKKSKSDYLLFVWDVPDSLSALVARNGFRATKKNPRHWYRLFQPELAADKKLLHEEAKKTLGHLKAANLQYSWKPVEASEKKVPKTFQREEFRQRQGGINFARHNVTPGHWHRRSKRR